MPCPSDPRPSEPLYGFAAAPRAQRLFAAPALLAAAGLALALALTVAVLWAAFAYGAAQPAALRPAPAFILLLASLMLAALAFTAPSPRGR